MNEADVNEPVCGNKQPNEHQSDMPVTQCKHYQRHCIFVSPCCGKLFPCRICHDENVETHTLNRHSVKEIICVQCSTKQSVSNICKSCGKIFGKYFCSVCRMFDDKDKGQFHCNGCGICRVGGKKNFFHCEKCGLCLPLSKETHKCIEKNSKQDCPICLQDLHTSRDTLYVSECNHLMHSKCFNMFLQKGNYRCPLCNVSLANMEQAWKSIDDEIQSTPMPAEYANMKVWILCQDCHKVSHVKFHVVGMKCAECGSYNTSQTDAPNSQQD